MGPDPNPSILLTRNKKVADPALAVVLFDPTWWYFFRSKREIFQTQTKDDWPDPSNKKLIRPNPGQKILTRTHYHNILSYLYFLLLYFCLFEFDV